MFCFRESYCYYYRILHAGDRTNRRRRTMLPGCSVTITAVPLDHAGPARKSRFTNHIHSNRRQNGKKPSKKTNRTLFIYLLFICICIPVAFIVFKSLIYFARHAYTVFYSECSTWHTRFSVELVFSIFQYVTTDRVQDIYLFFFV